MKKVILTLGLLGGLLLFSSTLYAQVQRNPVIEACTGTWCQWCPCGHDIIDQILIDMPNAVAIEYHGPAGSSDPWDDFPGNEIISLLTFSGYPTGVIDRTGPPQSRSVWASMMNARNSTPATVSIDIDKDYNQQTRDLVVTINVTAEENLSGQYKANLIILESGLVYPQTGNGSCPGAGDYVHNHVVRAMINNGAQGSVLNGGNPLTMGETYSTEVINYNVPAEFVADSCELAVIVYEVNSPFYNGEIQQADKYPLISPDYVINLISESEDMIVENDGNAEFTAEIMNEGLLDDSYYVDVMMDAPGSWSGEFTTPNGTFSFGQQDLVNLPVGETLEVTLNVNPNFENGYGEITAQFTSSNDPGVTVSAVFRTVTTTGLGGLVVDGSGEGYADFILNGMDQEFNYSYGAISSVALYDGVDLTNFSLIAWSVGNTLPVFEQYEVTALQEFMDNGGLLLINGQDIGEDIFEATGQSQFAQDFYNNYLHAQYEAEWCLAYFLVGFAGDPITDGLGFSINTLYDRDPDEISPYDASATPILKTSTTGKVNSLRADDGTNKVVYFGIGFEQIGDAAQRDSLVARSIRWLMDGVVLGTSEDEFTVNTFNLEQNYPNPFNPSTQINYSLADESQVNLKIYDVMGREVAELVNSKQSAGSYSVNFDASSLASGIYIYKLSAGDFISAKKMTLLK